MNSPPLHQAVQQAVEAVPREPTYDWKAIAEHYEAALRHLAENAFASKDWQFARAALNAGTTTAKLAASPALQQQEVPSEQLARDLYVKWITTYGLNVDECSMPNYDYLSPAEHAAWEAVAHLAAAPSTTEKPVSSEMLRQCAASGQMDSAQIHAHEVAGDLQIPDGMKESGNAR